MRVAVWRAPVEPVPVEEGLAAEAEPVSAGAGGSRWGAPWGTSRFRVTGTVPEGVGGHGGSGCRLAAELGP